MKRKYMKKCERTKRSNSTEQLLRLVAALAARASENEHLVQTLLAAIVKAATTETPAGRALPDDHSADTTEAPDDPRKDVLTDFIKDLMQKSADFDAHCRDILEGMSEAARAHDNAGAARAFQAYQRCVTRPRPLRPPPEP